jgi:MOSC domain-containing protein YiiM
MADDAVSSDAAAVTPVIKLEARTAWLGVGVCDAVETRSVDRLSVSLEGIAGDRHAGFARPADVRVPWHKRGTPIHNERQLSLVSAEELAEIADALDLAAVSPDWLGANILLSGIPRFSAIPRGTRLFFASGAVVTVTEQNAPCRIAGGALAKAVGGDDALSLRFVAASKRRRGVVAYVDRAGDLAVGDGVAVRVPQQWIWRPT